MSSSTYMLRTRDTNLIRIDLDLMRVITPTNRPCKLRMRFVLKETCKLPVVLEGRNAKRFPSTSSEVIDNISDSQTAS